MDCFDGYISFPRNVAIGKQGELLNEEDFQQFIEKYGRERATGYLLAMNDFTSYAEVILGGGYCRNGVPESGHLVRKYLRELVDHNETVLITKAKEFDLNFNR